MDMSLIDRNYDEVIRLLVEKGIPFVVRSGSSPAEENVDPVFPRGAWLGKPAPTERMSKRSARDCPSRTSHFPWPPPPRLVARRPRPRQRRISGPAGPGLVLGGEAQSGPIDFPAAFVLDFDAEIGAHSVLQLPAGQSDRAIYASSVAALACGNARGSSDRSAPSPSSVVITR